jgi:hypothetical protein
MRREDETGLPCHIRLTNKCPVRADDAGGLPLSKRCTRRGDSGSAQGAAAAWAANAHASMCACVEVPPCSGRSAAPGDGFRMEEGAPAR